MDSLLTVATQVGILFALMSVGFVARKTRLLGDAAIKGFVDFLVVVVTPALVIHAFERPFDSSMLCSLALAFAFAIGGHFVAIVLATAFLRHRSAPTENVLIENNTLISSCNALKIGTDTQGTFRNFLARNCVLGGTEEGMRHIKPLGADSGISWEMVDGGLVERILVTDVEINHARSPFFLRIDDRGRLLPEQEKRPVGRLQYLAFEHIRGEDNGPRGSYFLGYPGRDIEHVRLKDVHLKQLPAVQLPPSPEEYGELHGEYPDAHMLQIVGSGDAPAYGLWARHVKDLELEDYQMETCREQEVRPEYLLMESGEDMV